MVLCAAGRKLEGLLQRHCWQGSADVMSALCVCAYSALGILLVPVRAAQPELAVALNLFLIRLV